MSAYYKSIEVEIHDDIDIVVDVSPPPTPTREHPVLEIFARPTKEYPSVEVVRLLQEAAAKS